MKTLYINTCGIDIIIKLFKKNRIIREERVNGQKNNSQFIMPTIKKVLLDDMPDAILVVIGPGSFTGVRLGVTIAKTFAYVKNIPIRTVTTLEELSVSTRGQEKIVSIKENNGYFVGKFNKNNDLIDEYLYFSNEEYNNYLLNNKVNICKKINYKNVIKHANKKQSLNPHIVKPAYVKVIEALK